MRLTEWSRPDVSRETADRLAVFASLLVRWNRSINLVSRGDTASLWPRHVGDSLRLLPLIPAEARRLVDFGSGSGFPGLIIAIATGRPVVLVEADARKAAFLRQAAIATACEVDIRCARVEALPALSADVITARAFAPLARLLSYAHPHLAPGGLCLLPKGQRWQDEVAEARRLWQFDLDVHAEADRPGALLRATRLAAI